MKFAAIRLAVRAFFGRSLGWSGRALTESITPRLLTQIQERGRETKIPSSRSFFCSSGYKKRAVGIRRFARQKIGESLSARSFSIVSSAGPHGWLVERRAFCPSGPQGLAEQYDDGLEWTTSPPRRLHQLQTVPAFDSCRWRLCIACVCGCVYGKNDNASHGMMQVELIGGRSVFIE